MDFGFPKDEPADKCTKRRKMTAGFGRRKLLAAACLFPPGHYASNKQAE
jgi:hypothetical protein